MNKDNAHEYLPLVQALGDGKTIEYINSVGQWQALESVTFGLVPTNYRIKPEPREVWVNCYADGSCGKAHKSKEAAQRAGAGAHGHESVKFREVL